MRVCVIEALSALGNRHARAEEQGVSSLLLSPILRRAALCAHLFAALRSQDDEKLANADVVRAAAARELARSAEDGEYFLVEGLLQRDPLAASSNSSAGSAKLGKATTPVSPAVRALCAKALGSIGERTVRALLLALLDDDLTVRQVYLLPAEICYLLDFATSAGGGGCAVRIQHDHAAVAARQALARLPPVSPALRVRRA